MITGNEPAFSKSAFYHPDGGTDSPNEGMTLRQYFAAMAMQGVISNADTLREVTKKIGSNDDLFFSVIARFGVEYADALINELNKPKQ